jgi:hypothetical protein
VLKSTEMKKIIVIILGLIIFLFPQLIYAESNFATDYAVTYNVMENAKAHVTFDITLTNKTSQYYADRYSIQVGFKNIDNVLINDDLGKILPSLTKNNDGNNIEIIFNNRIAGLGKKLNFTVSFDTTDIVQKSGKIWDINIPGLSEQKAYNSFNVKVIVPKSLGSPSYIKPDSGKLVNGNLVFTKEELGESGISVAFGKEQIYSFSLEYHLKNPNLFPISTEIALPLTTNYQDVQISDILPKPQNVTIDADDNWLAQYILSSGKKMDITVKGYVKIMLSPLKVPETASRLKEYTKEQPYWQTNNKEIKSLALKLKTPHAIFQYVVNALKYDFQRVQDNGPRIGALGVLKKPDSAVCLEFTDLFIALARAAGIPAREINGFAYTQNSKERPLSLVKDVLHAWPEYYDEDLQTWVMVDPTWSNTTGGVDYFYTLDFDHFAFAIKGISSSYPVPAGGYKTSENDNSKDINVELGDIFPVQPQTLILSENFADSYFSGFAPQGEIIISNNSRIISSPQTVSITAGILTPLSQNISFGKIPPFGFLKIPVNFDKPALLTNKTDTVRITINKNYISKKIKITPFILNKWTILGGIIFVTIAVTISIIIFRTRYLSFFGQKR